MRLNKYDVIVLRTSLSLTQRQFGFVLNVTGEYINMIENGKKPLTDNKSREIIERFNINEPVFMAIRLLSDRLQELKNAGN
jgi:transcriptional regulator with XRE-family HTH domain